MEEKGVGIHWTKQIEKAPQDQIQQKPLGVQVT